MITRKDVESKKYSHLSWLDKKNVSNGQRRDSETIVQLCETVERMAGALESYADIMCYPISAPEINDNGQLARNVLKQYEGDK